MPGPEPRNLVSRGGWRRGSPDRATDLLHAEVLGGVAMNSHEPSGDDLGQILRKAGDHPVDVPIVCVVTRFGLRSPRYLLPMYLDFRSIRRDANSVPGLLQSAFLIENPNTCYTFSLWRSWDAIPNFGTRVPAHVDVARKAFFRSINERERRPEIWSTKWRLMSVSNNLNWSDFDLRQIIVAASKQV